MKIEYRNIREEDITSIVEILNCLFSGKWYRKITPCFFKEKVIKNPYFSFEETFVATAEKKKIVGFGIHISNKKDIGCIHSLCVMKEYQNQGIGKELLKRIEEIAIQRGEKQIEISYSTPAKLYIGVDSEDKKSIDFFLHQGYKVKDYRSEGIFYLDLKNFSIPEDILQKEKELKKQGYKIKFTENDERINELCWKNGAQGWIDSNRGLSVIMEKDGEVIGFCGYTLKDVERMGIGEGIPEWGPFLVSKEERGKGIGAVIMCRSLKEMKEKGCISVFLQTGYKSHGIYKALGFKMVKSWIQMYKELTS